MENVHPMNQGGKKQFDFGTVKCLNAVHSCSFSDRTYAGNSMGFLITGNEGNFYFSGDTALTNDMLLIPHWAKLDFAILCIGDNFTMGYKVAIEAARTVQCNKVAGVLCDTFPYIKINHQQAIQAFADAG